MKSTVVSSSCILQSLQPGEWRTSQSMEANYRVALRTGWRHLGGREERVPRKDVIGLSKLKDSKGVEAHWSEA